MRTEPDDDLWAAIADPSRRRVLDLLVQRGEASASRLAGEVPFSRQAVSKHLVVLEQAGLIGRRKEGREVLYRVDVDRLDEATRALTDVARQWDRRLEAIGSDEALGLRGKSAVAQAKLAYQLFLSKFSGKRWAALEAAGAHKQRPLWASTSTKNPEYPDTLYVNELIGPDTVDTLPEVTLHAFLDHGIVARTADADVAEAERVWNQLAEVGVDLDDVAKVLEDEGVAAFVKAFDELLASLDQKAQGYR
jgi:DNA-binding transcriptional ArsR family regulator